MEPKTAPAVRLDGGRVLLDIGARRLAVDGEVVKLGGRAFDVLVALVQHHDRVVSKQELLDLVWRGVVVEENTLQVHIAALRRVLGAQAVATVSGRGYHCTLSIEAHVPPRQAPWTLIGRDDLLAELAALLSRDEVRLLTLVGPGGAGKTRLALQVAARAAMQLRDGAMTVMLAAVRDPSQVMTAVAAALGLQQDGAVPAADLVRTHLRPRELLLMLDNLEHLPSPGEWLMPLLEHAPGLKVLVTSRVPTRLAVECVLRVPPLALPADDSLDALRAAPSVQLFIRRAGELGCAVPESPEALRAAGLVCQRLDGLPLAIELAAARLRVLTPVSLAERLQRALPLLTRGAADGPARHQTLRGAIAWSHDLLDASTQRLYRRLSVFVGGWTLEAAEAMDDEPEGVIDRIEALLDHSLVQRVEDVGGHERYAMLETLREFAAERLMAAGETNPLRERHARYYTGLAVSLAPKVASAGRAAALLRLRVELNNLRAALDWRVIQMPDAATALPLVAALSWTWYFEGLYREGLGWTARALALPVDPTVAPAARAAVLSGAARLAAYSGDVQAAVLHAESSVALWRGLQAAGNSAQYSAQDLAQDCAQRFQQGLEQGLAFARFHEGVIGIMSAALDRARGALTEALSLFREVDDAWGIALATSYLGTTYAVAPGLEAQARPLLEEGRARFRALGDVWGLTVSSHYLGSMALRTGDLTTAAALTHEMLANSRELGDKYRIARNLHQLAEIDLARGRVTEALHGLADSLSLNAEQQRWGDAALQLRLLTHLARQRGALDTALRFAALAEQHAGAALTMPPDDLVPHAAEVAALREALGPRGSLTPWSEGAAMTVKVAADAARALAD